MSVLVVRVLNGLPTDGSQLFTPDTIRNGSGEGAIALFGSSNGLTTDTMDALYTANLRSAVVLTGHEVIGILDPASAGVTEA